MTLVKQNYRSFNDLFDNFFGATYNAPGKPNALNVPPVNISETADAFHLEVLAPGLKKEDFKVNLEKGLLTISYEKKAETETSNHTTHRREFRLSGFKRSFMVDEKINADGIQARYESGVLNLLLPKKEEVKESPKAITIQ
ncbi:MAG TPA: Hsp20/alpha crystallin family protein [Panacibacter sp.]|nr:Hsp20/alpha crystallin family protein [Panacibacter sp.]HNP47079.1 Hsp20/alpha crystallin family protein [Panacibacter sp.]